jgi:topoisomerase-4 subunit A
MDIENDDNFEANQSQDKQILDTVPVSGMYENWFLEYASYVILDRAIPDISDGLKPVQRRILHSMFAMHDSRYHKVANIIGQTMQYHPHGDSSIGAALVALGQKELLIDMQGNWGDIRTGDSAAAARYIEARLSKFGLDVLFNPKTTEWKLSYDGRKKEPTTLPVKFPLLLAQGVEGIAVGLATKILPHNFIELIDASIKVLKDEEFEVFPDFLTGGMADFSQYNGGKRGGKVKVRAKIEQVDKKTLAIREIPFGTTTSGLIDSILKANDTGKIKIKKVTDNTAKELEILVDLNTGVSSDVAIAALYAFTDCEVSISPNACVIRANVPEFLTVADMLRTSTQNTKGLLKQELEIQQKELQEKIFFSTLEQLFIENKIYRDIEEAENWEQVLKIIRQGLKPFMKELYRDLTDEDIVKLTEIRIKRISKYDNDRANEQKIRLESELEGVVFNLKYLTSYAVNYFKKLKKEYAKGKERRTKIVGSFDTIIASEVAANNAKLYVNRKEGFMGTALKKEEFVCECSDIDEIIVFRKDGTVKVSKLSDKVFMGKDIIHIAVFHKGDERMVYNLAYLDPHTGRTMVKRFQILAVTRDREYRLTTDHANAHITYFSANPNGEAEILTVYISPASKAKKKVFDYDFSVLEVKGRGSKGNILSRYAVKRIKLKEKGKSTLGGFKIWYDKRVGTLNTDEVGEVIGEFDGNENILVVYKNGAYELTSCDLMNRYDQDKVFLLTKHTDNQVVSLVYYDGESKNYYAKRFHIETTTLNKKFEFLNDNRSTKIIAITTSEEADIEIKYKRKARDKDLVQTLYRLSQFTDIKGWKAIGTRIPEENVREVKFFPVMVLKKEEEKTPPTPEEEKLF